MVIFVVSGPSSVVKVFSFDGEFSGLPLAGNNGNTISAPPLECRTPLYTAGSGETAIVQLNATGSPTLQANDVLYVIAAVWSGTIWDHPIHHDTAESLTDGMAHAGAVLAVPLTAGKPYVFGTAFASNNALTISPGFCQGVVQIVKTAS